MYDHQYWCIRTTVLRPQKGHSSHLSQDEGPLRVHSRREDRHYRRLRRGMRGMKTNQQSPTAGVPPSASRLRI